MEGWGAEAPSDSRGFRADSKGGRRQERELGPRGEKEGVGRKKR